MVYGGNADGIPAIGVFLHDKRFGKFHEDCPSAACIPAFCDKGHQGIGGRAAAHVDRSEPEAYCIDRGRQGVSRPCQENHAGCEGSGLFNRTQRTEPQHRIRGRSLPNAQGWRRSGGNSRGKPPRRQPGEDIRGRKSSGAYKPHGNGRRKCAPRGGA